MVSHDFLSTARQKQRQARREADIARLKELGWVVDSNGRWEHEDSNYDYDLHDVVLLEQLRGNIKRGRKAEEAK